ncbi:MAG TPA: hypothetical protein VMT30_08365 [Candidatus Saccharimonadia bacterium]|nr:hypothetical protein [Candidatus Saccharimonadia bacterium]
MPNEQQTRGISAAGAAVFVIGLIAIVGLAGNNDSDSRPSSCGQKPITHSGIPGARFTKFDCLPGATALPAVTRAQRDQELYLVLAGWKGTSNATIGVVPPPLASTDSLFQVSGNEGLWFGLTTANTNPAIKNSKGKPVKVRVVIQANLRVGSRLTCAIYRITNFDTPGNVASQHRLEHKEFHPDRPLRNPTLECSIPL